MEIVVVGIDHKKTPLSVREKGSFTKKTIGWGIETLMDNPAIDEVVILSTCNRSEIYAATEEPEAAISAITDFYINRKSKELAPYLISHSGKDSLVHLYRVATGLDSMILGEDQILGQTKDALYTARDYGGAGKFLSQVFREAVTFAKKMKTEYKISETPLSLSATAVKYVRRQFDDYADKKVLIIGSGKMGTLALRHLAAEGFQHIYLTNRTFHPGDSYSDIFDGVNVYRYDERYDAIENMDVVISATASPHTVLRRKDMKDRTKPLTIIDLALPRDVEAAIGDMEDVTLVTIDDFKQVIDEKMEYRKDVAKKIEGQIGDEVDELTEWLKKSKVDKMVALFNDQSRGLADETIRILNKRYKFEGKDLEYLNKIVHSEFRKMVMPSIRRLKALDDDERIHQIEKTVFFLFNNEAEK